MPSSIKFLFHYCLLGHEAAFPVEFHGRSVAVPHIQCKAAASGLHCKFPGGMVQGLADTLAPETLIHAQIIDIQRPDIRQDVVVKVLLKDAAYEKILRALAL